MNLLSLEMLEEKVRITCDLDTNSGAAHAISSDQIDIMMNESLSELHEMLFAAYGPEYFRSTVFITTVSGTAEYDLPDDFMELLCLGVGIGESASFFYGPLRQWQPLDVPGLQSITSLGTPNELLYRIQNNQLVLLPTPRVSTWHVQVDYIPCFIELARDAEPNTFDDVNGWAAWAVLDTAIKCLDKLGQDSNHLVRRQMRQVERINRLAGQRDLANVPHMTDVQGGSEYRTRYRKRMVPST